MRRREFVGALVGSAAAAYLPVASGVQTDLSAVTRTGGETLLRRSELKELGASLRGDLLVPSSTGYDQARRIWNGMFDQRPAIIARCLGAADVMTSVDFARTHDLLVAVRGGGHSISGKSACQGGIVIDLSLMRSVRVDPVAKTARVQGGALLGDMDRETQAFGLIAPAGVVSHTGVGGLTLGGGIGWLMRKYGLTIDNLKSVDIITADGQFRRASAEENPDLFWAVRGGGGNFGVVTSFEFRLHALGTDVLAGFVLHSQDNARDLFNFFFDYTENAPDGVAVNGAMWITEEGEHAVGLGLCYAGPFKDGERALAPARQFGKPISDSVAPTQFVKLQQQLDRRNAHGRNYYIKGRHINDFDPALIDTLLERWEHGEERFTTMRIVRFGGAIAQVGESDTAWPHRDAMWDLEVGGHWTNPALSEKYVRWGREYWQALTPYTADSFYVNELMDEQQQKVRISYGDNYERLVAVKNTYDPSNLFRLNGNIRPTV